MERQGKFWHCEELRLSTFERRWVVEVQALDRNYGGDEMEHSKEKVFGNRLSLAGPMIDSYLKEIGRMMLQKLTRSKCTGLAPACSLFIPWGIMRFLTGLCISYGCDVKNVCGKRKGDNGTLFFFMEALETANKIFDPTRFDGTNFLVKRTFRKKIDELTKKKKMVFHGSAEIVLSHYTPIQFEYTHSTETVRINFYIQRYDADGFVVNASLQALMNQD